MNPFSYGVVVSGDNFYDRKEECKRIVETLSGGNNIVLYAPRRFGKTSLIFKVMEQLEKNGFICIYFDFMPIFSAESFVRLYSKAIAGKQNNLKKFINYFSSVIKNIRPLIGISDEGKPELSFNFNGASIDESTILQILSLPENLAKRSKPVLIFFDEFQEIEKLKNINFEELLRSKIQTQKNVHYLFLGSKTHILKAMFNEKKRPFYNSASQMTIGYLPESDTISFLQKKFSEKKAKISEITAKYIISVSGNIPNYIQLIAAELWQMTERKTTIDNKLVDESVSLVLALKWDYYMELYEHQSKAKKSLLLALIQSGRQVFSENYIKNNNLPNTSTLQRAVRDLINNGIIDKIGDEYFISDPLFRKFLQKYESV